MEGGGAGGDPCQTAENRTAALFVLSATGFANACEPLTNHANVRVFMMPPLIHADSVREREHLCIHTHTHDCKFGKDFVAAKSCAKKT